MVDWRNSETLNKVTKLAIGYFEANYAYDDYLEERNQKESKLSGGSKSQASSNNGKDKGDNNTNERDVVSDDSDFEEEEEEEDGNAVGKWDRNAAEELYLGTRKTLTDIYATAQEEDDDAEVG